VPRVALNAKTIRQLKAAGGRRTDYLDTVQPGLLLRVTPKGARTWAVLYHVGRTGRRYRLGSVDHMDLAAARQAAREIRSRVALGEDPQAERTAKRHAVAGLTVGGVIARFLGAVGKPGGPVLRETTRKEWARLLDVEVPKPMAARPAASLDRAALRQWGRDIAQRSPSVAAHAHDALRRVYSWAVAEELVTGSPFVGLKPPATRPKSGGVQSLAELRALVRALDAYPRRRYPTVVLLLLLTGTRKAAVLGMARGELQDLEGDVPLWVVPPDRSKRRASGRAAEVPHVVPLSQWAVRLVKERLEAIGPRRERLFPPARPRKAGERPKSESAVLPSRFLAELRQQASEAHGGPMEAWTVHGLRHTIATHLREQLGVDAEVADLILGHTRKGVTAIYDRSQLLAERRAALVSWAAFLERLKTEKKAEAATAQVLPHSRRR